MVKLSQHMFNDREQLKEYVGRKLYFYGVPIRYRNLGRSISEVIVSVYCPEYNLELDHLVLNLMFKQALRIHLFTPISFYGTVVKYREPKIMTVDESRKVTVMAETYGLSKVRNVRVFNNTLPKEISKWCLRQIEENSLSFDELSKIPNNGSREKEIILRIKQNH